VDETNLFGDMRPSFHQIEHRVKAHILVAFLGYVLWVMLKHLLRRKQSPLTSARVLSLPAKMQSHHSAHDRWL
jgi:transposase